MVASLAEPRPLAHLSRVWLREAIIHGSMAIELLRVHGSMAVDLGLERYS